MPMHSRADSKDAKTDGNHMARAEHLTQTPKKCSVGLETLPTDLRPSEVACGGPQTSSVEGGGRPTRGGVFSLLGLTGWSDVFLGLQPGPGFRLAAFAGSSVLMFPGGLTMFRLMENRAIRAPGDEILLLFS